MAILSQETRQKTLSVAVYLRVSTQDQGKHGYSLPEQERACRQKAEALAERAKAETGLPVSLQTFEFTDMAGGDLLERPELERVRAFVRDTRPDYFVCLDPDRFSRKLILQLLVTEEIEKAGCRLEFVQHEYRDSAEGRLFYQLRGAISEFEKAKILERTARGKRGKMLAGGIPHHLSIYGYEHMSQAERQLRLRSGEPDPGALAVNPQEAAWVRQMFEWVVSEQLGSQAIAERLNQFAVPAKNGGPWRRGVVADVLRNTTYTGRLTLNRYDFRGSGSQRQLPKERRTRPMTGRLRPAEDWITVSVPAIISQALFDQAQAVLSSIRRRSGTRLHPGRRGHLLSGVVTCGLCGAPMHYVWNNKINDYLLRCANKYPLVRGLTQPPPTCAAPYQRADRIEEAAWQHVRDWLADPNTLRRDLERRAAEPPNSSGGSDQLALMKEQLEQAKDGQKRVLYLTAKGVVHPEVAEAQLEESRRQIESLQHQVAELENTLHRRLVQADHIERTVRAARDLAAEALRNLDQLSLSQRQGMVRLLVSDVQVGPGKSVEVIPAEH